jgi:hypothetical protein
VFPGELELEVEPPLLGVGVELTAEIAAACWPAAPVEAAAAVTASFLGVR